jgi:dihydroorotate dehydrogenase
MPDWSYRTFLRPFLFRLPPDAARGLSLGVLGALGRSPLGGMVIDFMGHMRAPEGLGRQHMGLRFPTVVGLGGALDPSAQAAAAFARFGVGFLELGPVTLRPRTGSGRLALSTERGTIAAPDPPDNPGAAGLVRQLARMPSLGVPRIARLAVAEGTSPQDAASECRQMIAELAPQVDAFSVPAAALCEGSGDPSLLRQVVEAARQRAAPRRVLARVPTDLEPSAADALVQAAMAAGIDGIAVDGSVPCAPGRREIGLVAREATLGLVSRVREQRGPAVVLLASGGVHEPEDALRLLEEGADLVQVDSGLVFSGPGLPKRINEAVLYASHGAGSPDAQEASAPVAERSWFWSLLMGAGMLLGSVLALAISFTLVVLPYDEQFTGLDRGELAAINDRLLPFMAHDRVTLAGTMVTIGVLYVALSHFGIRRGRHWARVAVQSSALAGFASFFLFLGFGYFDPFHAFVTAILFQFFLLALHCRMGGPYGLLPPVLCDDRRWRVAQWGQLGLIVQSVVCLCAGLVISFVGVTQVFVVEDLEFMRTTREALAAANPRLIPLVAHDRATFGGMLVVSGMTFLMTSLWGFGRGAGWLWWAILLAGLSGYGPTLGIHYAVGYHSPWHLAPAWAGFALFLVTMALSYPHLCGRNAAFEEAWRAHRARWAAAGAGRRA